MTEPGPVFRFGPEIVGDRGTGFDGGIGLDKQTHVKSGFQISLT